MQKKKDEQRNFHYEYIYIKKIGETRVALCGVEYLSGCLVVMWVVVQRRRVSVRNRARRTAKSFTPVGGVGGLVSVVAAQSNLEKK